MPCVQSGSSSSMAPLVPTNGCQGRLIQVGGVFSRSKIHHQASGNPLNYHIAKVSRINSFQTPAPVLIGKEARDRATIGTRGPVERVRVLLFDNNKNNKQLNLNKQHEISAKNRSFLSDKVINKQTKQIKQNKPDAFRSMKLMPDLQ